MGALVNSYYDISPVIGIPLDVLFNVLLQTRSTLRNCIVCVQPWEGSSATPNLTKWASLTLPVLEEATIQLATTANENQAHFTAARTVAGTQLSAPF